MKNLYLSLMTLVFSGLLIGCGMKGPLYQEKSATQPQPVAEKTAEETK